MSTAAVDPAARATGRLADYLDGLGIGAGAVELEPIGAGHSNITYLLRRGTLRLVLRRPPLGPLARSANDVVREARVLRALAPTPVPAPAVVAVCADEAVLGAPFYLMEEVAGGVLGERLPEAYAGAVDGAPNDGGGEAAASTAAAAIADAVVDQLVAIHAVPLTGEVAELGRPDGYLERQVRRFGELLPANAARPLPRLEEVGAWLAGNRPASPAATVVHGDYRLGNLFFDPAAPRVTAVLDWEMATLGDPLADLGYLTAMWAEPGDEPNPMLSLSPLTQGPGFPGRADLGRRYADRTGADLGALRWYQVLAVWKSAIFLEGSFKRYRAGLSDDTFFAALDQGVPALARWAGRLIDGDGS